MRFDGVVEIFPREGSAIRQRQDRHSRSAAFLCYPFEIRCVVLLFLVTRPASTLEANHGFGITRCRDPLHHQAAQYHIRPPPSHGETPISPHVTLGEPQCRLEVRSASDKCCTGSSADNSTCCWSSFVPLTKWRQRGWRTSERQPVELVDQCRFEQIVERVDPAYPGEPRVHIWRVYDIPTVLDCKRDLKSALTIVNAIKMNPVIFVASLYFLTMYPTDRNKAVIDPSMVNENKRNAKKSPASF